MPHVDAMEMAVSIARYMPAHVASTLAAKARGADAAAPAAGRMSASEIAARFGGRVARRGGQGG